MKNTDRIEAGLDLLDTHNAMQGSNGDLQDDIVDAVANLLHYAADQGEDIALISSLAVVHANYEIEEEA